MNMAQVVTQALRDNGLTGASLKAFAFSATDGALFKAVPAEKLAACEAGSFPDLPNGPALMADLQRRLDDLQPTDLEDDEEALMASLELRLNELRGGITVAKFEQAQAELVQLRAAYAEQEEKLSRIAVDPPSVQEQAEFVEKWENLLQLARTQQAKLEQLEKDARPGVYEESQRLVTINQQQEAKIAEMQAEMDRRLQAASRQFQRKDAEIAELKRRIPAPVEIQKAAAVGLVRTHAVFTVTALGNKYFVRVEDVACPRADFTNASCGQYGCVYLCTTDEEQTAIKIGYIPAGEMEAARIAGENGVSPKVIDGPKSVRVTNVRGVYDGDKSLRLLRMNAVGPDTLVQYFNKTGSPHTGLAMTLAALIRGMLVLSVIHADLKADNVLVDHSDGVANRAWAIDWGFTARADSPDSSLALSFLSTLAVLSFYTTPESAQNAVSGSVLQTLINAMADGPERNLLLAARKELHDEYTKLWSQLNETERRYYILAPDKTVTPMRMPAPAQL